MEFEYKKSKILLDLIFGYFFLAISIFISIMIVRKFIIDWNEIQITNVIFGLIFIFLFVVLNYQFLGIAIIRNSYYKKNLYETFSIDEIHKKIIIDKKSKNQIEKIDFENVESLELYYSWNVTTLSSDLGYSKLNLNNGNQSLIITQNNINQYQIYKLFKNRTVKNVSKFANVLK